MSGSERFSHLYKGCIVLLPTGVGSYNPPHLGPASSLVLVSLELQPNSPLFGASIVASILPHVHPLRNSASSLAHRLVYGSDTSCNSPSPPLDIVLSRFSLSSVSSTRERFAHLYKGCSVLLPSGVGSYNPPSLGPASSLALVSFSNRCGTPTKSTPSLASIVAGTSSYVHPLRVSASSLVHRSVFRSDTNCNSLRPPLAYIVFSSTRYKFSHLYK